MESSMLIRADLQTWPQCLNQELVTFAALIETVRRRQDPSPSVLPKSSYPEPDTKSYEPRVPLPAQQSPPPSWNGTGSWQAIDVVPILADVTKILQNNTALSTQGAEAYGNLDTRTPKLPSGRTQFVNDFSSWISLLAKNDLHAFACQPIVLLVTLIRNEESGSVEPMSQCHRKVLHCQEITELVLKSLARTDTMMRKDQSTTTHDDELMAEDTISEAKVAQGLPDSSASKLVQRTLFLGQLSMTASTTDVILTVTTALVSCELAPYRVSWSGPNYTVWRTLSTVGFNPTNTAPPFIQVFDPSFLNETGSSITIRSIASNPSFAFAHEAPICIPDLNAGFLTSNYSGALGCNGWYKNSISA
ncbi:uncharacterized protein F5147DRAFT_760811 [Suillus discolor]|uniref:Uncharacterized protein n=1 Tax=Suillus discolor TaxID=1912936 RepID=A0A9P7JU23_9AGAM|nr:uncharacterized protein F5147DRAFT_760811 [Suillus discolor]KAG2108955.1 hypothetical protein F5147DRAFT_760811 [Suillus discolor]